MLIFICLFYRNIFPFLLFIPKESCCILSSHLSLHCHCIKIFFYLIYVIENTSANNVFASAQSAIFLAVTAPQDNIAIKPSMSTVRRFSVLYSVVFLMMHIPPFLRILLHHLPDSGYVRCQYIYFLFGLLTMIFHSVQRVGFHLYMAVSTLQLTSIRNLSEYW